MMKSFINLGLLNADDGHVFCLKLALRCDDFTAKAVRRKGVKTVIKQSVGVSPSLSVFVPLEEEEEVRKRSKKNIVTRRFTPPTDIETVSYFIEKGSTNAEAEKFWLFYDSKNWMVGKSKMQKWKSSASGWIKRNQTEVNKKDILAASSASNWHEEDLGI
jgi:hypothetical protein